MLKRTKIVCTIGPASASPKSLAKMIKAGMNVARLNFSHGDHKNHALLVRNIRRAAAKFNQPIAIIGDLQGPRIRVGELKKEALLKKSGEVVLTTREKNPGKAIQVTYKNLHKDIVVGQRILLADGLLQLRVRGVVGQDIFCRVISGGIVSAHKGINLPDTSLAISAVTKKDKEDLRFAVRQGVDWIALSFVKKAEEIDELRRLIQENEKGFEKREGPIKIIAKIEKHEAVKNLGEIIKAADGIMVARGDLGVEMPAEEVPLIQKGIIEQCLEAAKPVIVATQMLDSMIRNPRPTRAEVSDVANAVIDHTDAVMLSGETADGQYPLEAVEMMTKIIQETEKSIYDDLVVRDKIKEKKPIDEAISNIAGILAESVGATAVLVATLSGYTARIVSRFRPELPILVSTDNCRVQRQLNLSWAVVPFILPPCKTVEELVARSIGYIKKEKFVKKGDKIIIVAGEPVGKSGIVNLIEIREI